MVDKIDDDASKDKPEENSYGSAADVLGLSKSRADEDLGVRVATLEAEVEKYKELADEHKDKTLRAFAEVENMRAKALRDIKKNRDFAVKRLLEEMLPGIDSLEHAMDAVPDADDAIRQGLEMTHKMFLDAVQKFGISPVDPVGEVFDPELHEALSLQSTSEHEENTIVSVVQKGYQLNGLTVRPARVIVAKSED